MYSLSMHAGMHVTNLTPEVNCLNKVNKRNCPGLLSTKILELIAAPRNDQLATFLYDRNI